MIFFSWLQVRGPTSQLLPIQNTHTHTHTHTHVRKKKLLRHHTIAHMHHTPLHTPIPLFVSLFLFPSVPLSFPLSSVPLSFPLSSVLDPSCMWISTLFSRRTFCIT